MSGLIIPVENNGVKYFPQADFRQKICLQGIGFAAKTRMFYSEKYNKGDHETLERILDAIKAGTSVQVETEQISELLEQLLQAGLKGRLKSIAPIDRKEENKYLIVP